MFFFIGFVELLLIWKSGIVVLMVVGERHVGMDRPIEELATLEADEAEKLLRDLGMPVTFSLS